MTASTSTPARTNGDAGGAAPAERWATVLAGSGLLWYGLRRRSLPGLGMAALGGALLQRGAKGTRISRALGLEAAEPLHITEAVQVSATPEQVYRFWRDLQNLPRFMRHLESVTPQPDGRISRWVARLSGAPEMSWDAEVVEDTPGQVMAWRSLPGADVENAGTVRFVELPHGRGTGVRVDILYRPPAGALGRPFARLLTPVVRQQIREDVRRFKSVIEAGEAPTTEGQPSGAGAEAWDETHESRGTRGETEAWR
jgi:uncharacterized membrane protein